MHGDWCRCGAPLEVVEGGFSFWGSGEGDTRRSELGKGGCLPAIVSDELAVKVGKPQKALLQLHFRWPGQLSLVLFQIIQKTEVFHSSPSFILTRW